MPTNQSYTPRVSFCMSTFNRPVFLEKQLGSLLQQKFTDFEIVISDNDPQAGGEIIAEGFNDNRIKYQCNGENIGMVPSYNRSIDRALGEFIVMVTDDDPVEIDFLETFIQIAEKYPNYSLYAGVNRKNQNGGEIELISKEKAVDDFLNSNKTEGILWSSCLFTKVAMLQIGKLQDYGGPHLVDHALLVMGGSINGAVLINKMYSHIGFHDNNFSKSNLITYYYSCTGFYKLINEFLHQRPNYEVNKKILISHLNKWFIVCMFNLMNYFRSAKTYNADKLTEIKKVAEKILILPYMQKSRFRYRIKLMIFNLKFKLGIKK